MSTPQLSFPFAWEEVPLVATGGGRLGIQCPPWGLRWFLELPHAHDETSPRRSLWRRGKGDLERLEAEVRIMQPAQTSSWSRSPILLVPGFDDDGAAVDTEIATLLGFIAHAQRRHGGRRQPRELARAEELLRNGAAQLGRLGDRRAIDLARGFFGDRALHWFVYESVVNDPSGRVAQMIDVCPGLLILAKGLRDRGRTPAAHAILAAIVRGHKLGRVLELATRLWRTILAPEVPRTSLALQRQRVRRAGKAVTCEMLLTPSLPGVVIADIPREPAANARWYELTQLSDEKGRMSALAPATLRALGSFLSRHWPSIEAGWTGHHVGVEHVLSDVIDYLHATGRRPDRKTSPDALLGDVLEWHWSANWREEAGLSPETELPIDSAETSKHLGDTLQPLGTVAALIQESERMHNCVASQARQAINVGTRFFHAEINGNALTVSAAPIAGRLIVIEAKGVSNRELTAYERDRVEVLLKQRRRR